MKRLARKRLLVLASDPGLGQQYREIDVQSIFVHVSVICFALQTRWAAKRGNEPFVKERDVITTSLRCSVIKWIDEDSKRAAKLPSFETSFPQTQALASQGTVVCFWGNYARKAGHEPYFVT